MSRITSSKRNFERSGPSCSEMPVEPETSAIRTDTRRRSPVVVTAITRVIATGVGAASGGPPARSGELDRVALRPVQRLWRRLWTLLVRHVERVAEELHQRRGCATDPRVFVDEPRSDDVGLAQSRPAVEV